MKITSLSVRNFRAVEYAHLQDLGQTVVIAGPNGCGKSSLFDALRLWKSSFGDYQSDEIQQWVNEFQLRVDATGADLSPVFRDKTKPVEIAATVVLSEAEKEYIHESAPALIRQVMWTSGQPTPRPGQRRARLAEQLASHSTEVASDLGGKVSLLNKALERDAFEGSVTLESQGGLRRSENLVLQVLFSNYIPQAIGIIEYQPSQRTYQREQMGGVDLNSGRVDRGKQHALYDFTQKYQNLKAQLAESYLRELVAASAGQTDSERKTLTESLQELFRLFFPGKEFLGLMPLESGQLRFPVRVHDTIEHDIDDLSSGEKEVLFGYLRLKNLSPRNSILLLDEPELHLNPRLVRGLPQFYHRHLGAALNNQIWLLTHSDVLVEEAMSQAGMSVFHMVPPPLASDKDNQIRVVDMREDVDRLVVHLMGEHAAFQPGRKVVIFEGGGSSNFDVTMTTQLFPLFRRSVNTISGTDRTRVRHLHALLEKARDKLRSTFYSVVDRDSDEPLRPSPARHLTWDVYHIENYLLAPQFLLDALIEIQGANCRFKTAAEVHDALKLSAEHTIDDLVRIQLSKFADDNLKKTVRIDIGSATSGLVESLRHSVESSLERMRKVSTDTLTLPNLRQMEERIRHDLNSSLRSEQWLKDFRGRDVLKRFVRDFGRPAMSYEELRNTIIAKMRAAEYQPPGMRDVIDRILKE